MTCMVLTALVAGPCSVCGQPLEPAHVIDEPLGIYCSAHCPVHKQVSIDFDGEAETISGEQSSLFGSSSD